MPEPREWRSGFVVKVLVTATVSGLIGAAIQWQVSKPRPMLVVTSVGFCGGEKLIELPDNVLELSQKDTWGDTLNRYVTFDTLLGRDKKAAEIDERLRLATAASEEWLADDKKKKAHEEMSVASVAQHPYMKDNILGSELIGLISRSELGASPIRINEPSDTQEDPCALGADMLRFLNRIGRNIDDAPEIVVDPHVTRLFPLWPYEDSDGEVGFELYLKTQRTRFPIRHKNREECIRETRQLAESFARGVRANIWDYTKQFIDHAKQDRQDLSELQKALHPMLLREARITVQASIVNTGGRSVVFRPYFGLKLLHQEFTNKTYIMSARPLARSAESSEPKDALSKLVRRLSESEDSGQEVSIAPFLPWRGLRPQPNR